MTAHRKRRGSKALRQQRPDNTQHGATALCPSNENKEDAGEGERYLIYFQPFGVTSSGKPSLISPDGVILFSWFSIGCAHILPLFPLHCEFGSFPCPFPWVSSSKTRIMLSQMLWSQPLVPSPWRSLHSSTVPKLALGFFFLCQWDRAPRSNLCPWRSKRGSSWMKNLASTCLGGAILSCVLLGMHRGTEPQLS